MLGKTLAHYEILSQIGAGGMGEVYRARDTKLGRDVALKILPPARGDSADRRRRFELEARAVAALRHPNIVTIHSAEEFEGISFLTMEFIEGEDLRSRLRPQGMEAGEFLTIAEALSDAIAAAHAKGIMHRDLKPSNIMLESDGTPKVLDFGLAKLFGQLGEESDPEETVEQMTRAGAVVGTVPYMSPEQLSGAGVDHRSDIFSVGIILYEMATGRHPFASSSEAETISSILRDDPPALETLAPAHDPAVQRIIRECLHKDPERRIQNASEIRDALRALRTSAKSPSASFGAWRITLALLAIVAIGFLWSQRGELGGRSGTSPSADGAGATSVIQVTTDAALEEWPAWAPDGSGFVCSEDDGIVRHLVHHLPEARQKRRLTQDSHDEIQASWFPGGSRLAFVRAARGGVRLGPSDVYGYYFEGGDVWSLDLEDGSEEKLVENAFHPRVAPGGSRLAFDAEWVGARRIWISDERGRNARQITTDASEAVVHVSPAWSPDGDRLAYRVVETTRSDIAVVDLETSRSWRLTDDQFHDLNPVWSPDGDAVLFSSNRAGGVNIWRLPVDEAGAPAGVAQQLTFGPGQDLEISVSADGSRILYTILGLNSDIWRLPLGAGSTEVAGAPEILIASTREDSRAAWSPDGSLIAFNSDRLGHMNLWLYDLRDGSERPLTEGPGGDYQPSWSGNGEWITFFSSRDGNPDVWRVEVSTGELRQLTFHPALDTNPFASPDGRWIAFQSDRGGRKEVWLIPAGGGEARPLSKEGTSDHFMRWSRDSRHLYFDDLTDALLHRVDIETGEIWEYAGVRGGSHISLSPDESAILDVTEHRVLWNSPLGSGDAKTVFEMPDPEIRLDYPNLSPDGKWVVFDAVRPSGGDIWVLRL